MQIEINNTDEHNDYFTLTDDVGIEYQWHGRKGIDQDPEKVLLLIRKREYPRAKFDIQEGETELAAIEKWIEDGAVNPEISEEYQFELSPAEYEDVEVIIPATEDVVEDGVVVQPGEKEKIITETKLIKEAVFETRIRILESEKIIEKKEWVSTHPKKFKSLEKLKNAKTLDEVVTSLLEIL